MRARRDKEERVTRKGRQKILARGNYVAGRRVYEVKDQGKGGEG